MRFLKMCVKVYRFLRIIPEIAAAEQEIHRRRVIIYLPVLFQGSTFRRYLRKKRSLLTLIDGKYPPTMGDQSPKSGTSCYPSPEIQVTVRPSIQSGLKRYIFESAWYRYLANGVYFPPILKIAVHFLANAVRKTCRRE